MKKISAVLAVGILTLFCLLRPALGFLDQSFFHCAIKEYQELLGGLTTILAAIIAFLAVQEDIQSKKLQEETRIKKEVQSVATAIFAEISAVMEIVSKRDMINVYQTLDSFLASARNPILISTLLNNFPGFIAEKEYFTMYKSLANKIGSLGNNNLLDICRFYTLATGILETMDGLGNLRKYLISIHTQELIAGPGTKQYVHPTPPIRQTVQILINDLKNAINLAETCKNKLRIIM